MSTIFQYLLPHHLISKIAHFCANNTVTWFKIYLINYFINKYPVNLVESKLDISQFQSFNHFFTRELKDGARTINPTAKLISPADGSLSQLGYFSNKQSEIIVKNHPFVLEDLLAQDQKLIANFSNPAFATIYLAPQDYHRVHMPCNGTLTRMLYVPGKLFSVNPTTVSTIPSIFSRNERVLCEFDTEFGKLLVVLVGAMIVGSIETTWHGVVSPPHHSTIKQWDYTQNKISLQMGDELGRFRLGSTVIILVNATKENFQWHINLHNKNSIQMGNKLA